MVKLQKPTPKTLNKDINKPKKSVNFKKEKSAELKKAITATNNVAKKEKLKLIEKAISNNEKPKESLKGKKKSDKNKTVEAAVKEVTKEEPIFKKVEMKNKKKTVIKEEKVTEVKETKVKSKQEAKKSKKSVVENPKKQTTEEQPKQEKLSKKDKNKKATAPVTGKEAENGTSKESVAASKTKKYKKNNKKTKGKKEKETAVPKNPIEAIPFDEEKFNTIVNLDNIKNIGKALKKLVEKEVKEKKNSIFEDYRYLLNVCCFKIPNCPKRVVKLNLAHSLVDPNVDDVVIIVPDLQRGAKIDYEPTIQHYEDLFREHGISGLKIVPFNQLRQECTTFETKRKFASTYDYFLCDGRIVGHVASFGGKSFQRTRTTFHAVRLNNLKKLKQDVQKALKRTCYKQLEKGDLISIPVGNHKNTVDELSENIKLVVDQLKSLYPGGLGNIRNMHVKIDIAGTSSLPLYASLAAPPAETPNVIGMREQRMLKLKKEANEVLSQFNMSKTGEFVKLDKTQAERKRKIVEARQALLNESVPDVLGGEEEAEAVPAKKSKKNKTELKKTTDVCEEENDDEVENGEVELDEDEDDDEEVEEDNDDDDDDDDEDEDDDDEDDED